MWEARRAGTRSIEKKHKGLFCQGGLGHAGGGDQWINTKEEEGGGDSDVSAAESITRRFTCVIVGEDVFVRSIRKEKDVLEMSGVIL